MTRRQRVLCYVILNCIALSLVGFGPPKLVDREVAATVRLGPGELRQWAEAAEAPAISAAALVVYDVDAQRSLYARRADAALPPASLTKLMTALLVLESGHLDDEVTILDEDLMGGSSMGLAAGETLTVQELLWGLLVASGNDAAMAVARHLAGDVPGFVEAMNRRAAELGMDQTSFRNPHGLDEEGHVAGAGDLINLTLRLLDYPLFMQIVGSRTAEIAGHILINTNELLGAYPGANGVKTGTTDTAGECLMAGFETEGRQVLIVVLGSSDRYGDVEKLHSLYQANYVWAAGNADDLSVLNRLYGPDGAMTFLQAQGEIVSVLRHRWGDPELTSFRSVEERTGEGSQSMDVVGRVEWRVGDVLLGAQELTVR